MKRIILSGLLLAAIALGLGCSGTNSFSGEEEKVKNVTIEAHTYPSGAMKITAIKLLQNITVEDSMNYYLQYSDEIIRDHDAAVQKLNFWVGQKENKSYNDYDVDAEIKRWKDELTRYVDAFEGKTVGESWPHEFVYRKLYQLRQLKSDKVLRRIYSVTYTVGASKPITEIRSFDADITRTFGTYSDMERINWLVALDIDSERIHFKRPGETTEELPEAEFIQEGSDIKEFDENGNPVE